MAQELFLIIKFQLQLNQLNQAELLSAVKLKESILASQLTVKPS